MDRTNDPIDEYTLAAFMAGTLSRERREEVASYLAQNSDARELLQMAYEALNAARSAEPVPEEQAPVVRAAAPPRPPRPREAERAATPPRALRRLGGLRRYMAAAAVVFTVGISLRLAFGPPTDALRSQPAETMAMTVQVDASDLEFVWSNVPDAYEYRLVIWDLQEARVVARHETTGNALAEDDPFVASLRPQLAAGKPYTIRIDAIDAQNRLILSSDALEFTPRD